MANVKRTEVGRIGKRFLEIRRFSGAENVNKFVLDLTDLSRVRVEGCAEDRDPEKPKKGKRIYVSIGGWQFWFDDAESMNGCYDDIVGILADCE